MSYPKRYYTERCLKNDAKQNDVKRNDYFFKTLNFRTTTKARTSSKLSWKDWSGENNLFAEKTL